MNNKTAANLVEGELVPATEQPTELAPVQPDPMMTMMQAFERIATNPGVTPEKVHLFLDAQERVLNRQAHVEFNAAMVNAHSRMQIVLKNRQGERSRYADLEAILAMCRPIYTDEGFAVTFAEGFSTDKHPLKDGCIRMVADIMHQSGHTKTVTADVPLDDRGPQGQVNKTGTQATGSSFSYGRRFLNCMIWNIGTGDDNNGTRPDSAPDPLSKARKAQQARQQGAGLPQQGQPQDATGNGTQAGGPPQQPTDPRPPAQNVLSEAEKQERKDFAEECNVLALEHSLIEQGQSLRSEDFRALLNQAKALGGTNSMVDATKYMTSDDVKMIVRDSAGIRIIGK